MEKLSNVYITEYIPTIYTTPCTMYYKQNGKDKKCNIFAERNGVVIIVYNSTRNVLILVKQFRAAVHFNKVSKDDRKHPIDVKKYPAKLGITLEFCAGLEDKELATEEIAREEILEECGYEVPISKLERICTNKNLTDTTGARTTWYYCEVTDDMKVSEGGGEIGENVEVVEMPVDEVVEHAMNPECHGQCPMNFMFGLYWFLYNKYHKSNVQVNRIM